MIMAYPGGIAGVAFLLMRVQAALIVGRLAFEGHGLHVFVRVSLGLLGGACLLGLLTRAAAAIACVVLLATISNAGVALACFMQALALVALAMVGPGAWSLDARLFGRRVIYSNSRSAAHKGEP